MGVGQQNGNRRQDSSGDDWDALKGDMGEMTEAAVERGRYFIETAREQATDYADRRKGDIAQSVTDFATSLRDSTHSFDDRPNIRAVVDSAADGLEQLADSIRDRSFADIFNDFEEVVRHRPATVAAVSVAIGFLTARFLKSTAEDLRQDRMNPDVSHPDRSRSQGAQRSRARA